MAKTELKSREPLSEQEVWDYLSQNVAATEKQWGTDNLYSEWARKAREEKMAEFHEGKVVSVCVDHYVDNYGNGCGNYTATLYSDGHVETACYGYLD